MKQGTSLTKKIRIGSMDEIITFRSVTESQSSSGYPVTSWSDAFSDYASVEYWGGMNIENYQAGAQVSDTRIAFITRYNSNTSTVTTKYRIEKDDKEYDIEAITEPLGRRRFLKFQCRLRE